METEETHPLPPEKTPEEQLAAGKKELRRLINRRARRGVKKLEKMRQEMAEAVAGETYKHMAETLLANRHALNRRTAEVMLPDVYDPTVTLTIKLDPAKQLQDNVEKYFNTYRKLQHRLTKLPGQLSSAEESLDETRLSLNDVDAVTTLKGLEKLTADLTARRILPPPPGSRTKDVKTGRKVGYREYTTTKDWLVLVGKTDADNDYLTFKVAGPHDYWFHVDGAPGSHTVLKLKSKNIEPDYKTLCEAASVAAWYSKHRNATKVPVSYTQRKFVRKPKRAKAGTVTIEREKTLYVVPGLPESEKKELPGRGSS